MKVGVVCPLSLSLSPYFTSSLSSSFPFLTLTCSPSRSLLLRVSALPLCIVGTANRLFESGLQKQLDRRRRPLETSQAVKCPSPLYPPPPLPAHLSFFSSSTHFNLFFPLSLSLRLLLHLSPLLTLLHLSASSLRLTSFHLCCSFPPPSSSKITFLSFCSMAPSETKFQEAKL